MNSSNGFLRIMAIATLALGVATTALADEAEVRAGRGIYDKPYLTGAGGGVAVGGYMDMELEIPEDGITTFDQYHFVPFITGYVSDRVTVSAEIEFEHGGQVEGGGGGDGEIKIEYAVMDYRFSDGFNFRGGVVLSPLGRFNVLHDSPLNDLTERPLVARQLVPSTLSEAGMGFFGDFAAGDEGELDYEVYLVNGFDEGIIDGDQRLRVRGGRGSAKQDNNDNKSLAGRLGYSPRLGTTIGVSAHTGAYDDAGSRNLTIGVLDAKTTLGALELQGEAATVAADIDRDLLPLTADSQRGAYLQAGWHLLHDRLSEGSVVTLVVRGNWVDYDSDRDGDAEQGLAVGANFRPTEETVFRADYTWRRQAPADGEMARAPGRFYFSFATYF